MVIVNGPQMLDDVRKRPDEELSLLDSIDDVSLTMILDPLLGLPHGACPMLTSRALPQVVQISWIFGHEFHTDPYHIDLIKEKLTRSLPAVLPDVVDELRSAIPQYIPTHGGGTCPPSTPPPIRDVLSAQEGCSREISAEWTTIDAVPTFMGVVARLSNRVFVGLPICELRGGPKCPIVCNAHRCRSQ